MMADVAADVKRVFSMGEKPPQGGGAMSFPPSRAHGRTRLTRLVYSPGDVWYAGYMIFDPGRLSDFARSHGFHYDRIDPAALVSDALADMGRGLEGLPSGMPMIPAHIAPAAGARAGRTVLALDAGGTNMRVARVSFDGDGRAAAGEERRFPMPGTGGRVSAERFFDLIAEAALAGGALDGIDGIGFTFSFHMDIRPDADGVLRAFSKEVDAPEVVGRAVGAGLRDALARAGRAYDGPVVLLNDTAATLLAGVADVTMEGSPAGAGATIGFILGTGLNIAYPETHIPKIGLGPAGAPQIVVCETGNFAPRFLGSLDRDFDASTMTPGAYALEKTVSGAYLGPLILHALKRAVRDGVLSFARSAELLSLPSLDTRSADGFLRAPFSAGNPLGALFGRGEEDAVAAARYLAEIVAERGALFAACMLTATVERMRFGGARFRPGAPARIAVEGSTFMAFAGMRRAIEAWLHVLLSRKGPTPYVVAPVERASLLGAAVAAAGRL